MSSAAPLTRVLSYADQVGVDTGSLRKRMRLELDMPVLLDSTVPTHYRHERAA